MANRMTDSEMKSAKESLDVGRYRGLVQSYLKSHMYESALFWADKVAALSHHSPKDVYWVAQCMYHLQQYHRAAHLLRVKQLDKMYIVCNVLVVRCLLEAHEYNEALKTINLFDRNDTLPSENTTIANEPLFPDTPRNVSLLSLLKCALILAHAQQLESSIFLLKAKVLEAMDNRSLASEYYKKALQKDVHCYEAFDSLTQYNMLTAEEEHELIHSLLLSEQCTSEEAEVLLILYNSKLKKYHVPNGEHMAETNNQQSAGDTNSKHSFQGLYDSLDILVANAEQLYYNCEYQKCLTLMESILKQDPYHDQCLKVHISCLVELKQGNKLFTLAHKLVELYPNLALSWYAVGCYYYVIDKCDAARRFLGKATSLDRLFGPAWLAYGHSFAIENEHDQAMAAYFKASQLMKGCHLPLLYIGLECGLTNNMRLAEKFFKQANKIAPDDPFVLHERGVIAFHNQDYHLAETYYRTALKIIKSQKCSPMPEQWAPLHHNLGHTLRKQKHYKLALAHHHKALALMPQNANVYSAIAYVHSLMGNLDEAADWFHRALGLKRDDTFSTTMLNYIIEQLCEEQDPYPHAPDEVPRYETPLQSDEPEPDPQLTSNECETD